MTFNLHYMVCELAIVDIAKIELAKNNKNILTFLVLFNVAMTVLFQGLFFERVRGIIQNDLKWGLTAIIINIAIAILLKDLLDMENQEVDRLVSYDKRKTT